MNPFTTLGLDEELIEAITLLGYETPTEIQTEAIPKILDSERDLIALAQTGTGKTGAFGLSCIQKINRSTNIPQLLVLAPTRELALQTAKELKKFSKKKSWLKSVALYGGTDYTSQTKALRKGCQIVVGTPGRTLDYIRKGRLDLSQLKMVVLDEADEMLKMGFQEDLEAILAKSPDQKQTLLFSATMPKTVERMASNYLVDPDKVSVGERNSGAEKVEHLYYLIHPRDRMAAIKRLVDANPDMYGIIFCRTRVETVELSAKLRQDGYDVDLLNGDLSQEQRDYVMNQFHRKDLRLLIATDVASRGLDVNSLTHIINYNLPDELPVYVHRSGRTGRAGLSGKALSLITRRESGRIHSLKRMVGQPFIESTLPTNADIYRAQLTATVTRIDSIDMNEQDTEVYEEYFAEALSKYPPEEVIQRMALLLCGNILQGYSNSRELQQPTAGKERGGRFRERERGSRDGHLEGRRDRDGRREGRRDRDGRRGNAQNQGDNFGGPRLSRYDFDGELTRCEINLGRRNHMTPNRLMGLINECFKGPKPHFGKISIQSNSTTFDIDSQTVSQLMSQTQNRSFEGRSIEVCVQQ